MMAKLTATMKVYVDGVRVPLLQALKVVSDEWIEQGKACDQTLMDIRDACQALLEDSPKSGSGDEDVDDDTRVSICRYVQDRGASFKPDDECVVAIDWGKVESVAMHRDRVDSAGGTRAAVKVTMSSGAVWILLGNYAAFNQEFKEANLGRMG